MSSTPSDQTDSKQAPDNPFSQPTPWNLVAEGYDETVRPFLAQFSEGALPHLNLTQTSHLLDVACGPGTTSLMAAPQVKKVTAVDFSGQMLSQLRKNLETESVNNVAVVQGDGQDLPFEDDTFDAAISMFGLMFFPDRVRGMKEIHRVLTAGGKVVVASWAPSKDSPLMKNMFDAVRAIDPSRPEPEADMESLENPDLFARELREAGFSDIQILPLERSLKVETVEEFWSDMVRGSVPLVMMKQAMPEDQWNAGEQRALQRLSQLIEPGSELASTAYLGVGRRG